MKSIIIPNKTANITDPINAKKNIQPLNPPLSDIRRFKKKKCM